LQVNTWIERAKTPGAILRLKVARIVFALFISKNIAGLAGQFFPNIKFYYDTQDEV